MNTLYAVAGLILGVALLFFGGRIAPSNRVAAFAATAVGMFCVAFAMIVLYVTMVPVINQMLA